MGPNLMRFPSNGFPCNRDSKRKTYHIISSISTNPPSLSLTLHYKHMLGIYTLQLNFLQDPHAKSVPISYLILILEQDTLKLLATC